MDKRKQYFKYFKNKYFIVIQLIAQCGENIYMVHDKILFRKLTEVIKYSD